jgi:hypothetical protein
MWGRAVAPVAEWVAQALWNSSRSRSTNDAVPTRLTQRRRIEGRGNELRIGLRAAPKRIRVCELCGAEGIRKRYCPSCAVEVARENMAALIGHSKPKNSRVKARFSKTLSDHAVANTWWSPSSLPEWLNEEFYTREVQPMLRKIKVKEIGQALQVSQPYAALIRLGRRRPHPRHWEALARLVGVSSPA